MSMTDVVFTPHSEHVIDLSGLPSGPTIKSMTLPKPVPVRTHTGEKINIKHVLKNGTDEEMLKLCRQIQESSSRYKRHISLLDVELSRPDLSSSEKVMVQSMLSTTQQKHRRLQSVRSRVLAYICSRLGKKKALLQLVTDTALSDEFEDSSEEGETTLALHPTASPSTIQDMWVAVARLEEWRIMLSKDERDMYS